MLQYPHLEQALKHHFGYDQFRPGQRQIIEDALENRDVNLCAFNYLHF